MLKLAILGANGFIGGRLVEFLHLTGEYKVCPIVRNFPGLARLARFDLDWRIADARDEGALKKAFEGCDLLVHAVTGDEKMIADTLAPVYRAAQSRKIKRMVYLSSASVHGQDPDPGTDENSALHENHPLAYNNAKVNAERKLLQLRAQGDVELIMLRPGIVFGPRSRWVSTLAEELLAGTAYLVDGGSGICNSIYVDNVIHAIRLSFLADNSADKSANLIGDRERVTWKDFYCAIAKGLGISEATIANLKPPVFERKWKRHLGALRSSAPVQAVLPFFPQRSKTAVKAAISAWRQNGENSPWQSPVQAAPVATQELALLHQCRWQFPFEKARRTIGYEPVISFAEGCRRSIEWLKFAGYPVENASMVEV